MKLTFAFLLLSSYIFSQDFKLAFGSCMHQEKSLSIFDVITEFQPNCFVFLGDNIYGDSRDTNVLKKKYDQLAGNSNYKNLKNKTKILATWDDHDYGENDAGKYYPMKKESKRLFLAFFEEPMDSKRYTHEGIYTSYIFKKRFKRIQLILLDNRTFRSDLKPFEKGMVKDSIFKYDLENVPIENSDSTMLGKDQWQWLENEFKKKADVRIIGSSTQFGVSYNGYESWANFPREKEKMLKLIQKTKAQGVFFISGDVHYAELSKLQNPFGYPIYDLTASGLTQSWHLSAPNSNRIDDPVMENHFGMLDFNFKNKTVQLQIIDRDKNVRINYPLKWKELMSKSKN
jgi:alkaline phosphatase D